MLTVEPMPIRPDRDEVQLDVELVCADCGGGGPATLGMPLHQRSLGQVERTFARLQSGRREPGDPAQPCPGCGSLRLNAISVCYRFDEPGLPSLLWTPADGWSISGASVRDEETLLQLAGRPFSPATHHRAHIQSAERTVLYAGDTGLLHCAWPNTERMRVTQLRAEERARLHDGWHLTPWTWSVGWGGPGLWLGDPAGALLAGRLNAATWIDGRLCQETLCALAAEAGVEATPDQQGTLLHSGRWSLHLGVSDIARLVLCYPLTLYEACTWAIHDALGALGAARGLWECWEPAREGSWLRDLNLRWQDADGWHAADIWLMARIANYDPESLQQALHAAHGRCHCQPQPRLIIRADAVVRGPQLGTAVVLLAQECEHGTRHRPIHSWREWRAAQRARRAAPVRARLRALHDADGDLSCVWLHAAEISGLLTDPRMLRGLAAELGLAAGPLMASAPRSDVLAIAPVTSDPETVALEGMQVRWQLGPRAWWSSRPVGASLVFEPSGAAAGRFLLEGGL